MDLLTQNSKMKKSSKNGITNVNWTIPAFQSKSGLKTCPNAGLCAVGCYARSGTFMFSNVRAAHEAKLELTQNDTFIGLIIADVERWLKKRNVGHLKVRIHDAGDFYDLAYLNRWVKIMRHFETNPNVSFYAYTKQVKLFQTEKARLPSNFRAIFSFGGKQDALIDIETEYHARVFETVEALEAAGYQNGTEDDMVAAMGSCLKIGLCYHGVKNYANTKWSKVA